MAIRSLLHVSLLLKGCTMRLKGLPAVSLLMIQKNTVCLLTNGGLLSKLVERLQ